MTSVIVPLPRSGDTISDVALRAGDVARHYGEGETAVHALRGIDLNAIMPARRAPRLNVLDARHYE